MRLRPMFAALPRVLVLMLVLMLGFVAAPAHADFKRSYAKGLDAYGEGKFDEAEKLMREALADEATPQAKVKLYGMRFEPYVPQFYLGMLAYKRGDCAGAMRFWDSPGVASIVGGESTLSGLAAGGQRDCKTKLASTGTTTTTSVATTEPSKPPVSPTTTTTGTGTTTEPTVVATARTTTTTAPPPPPPPPPVKPPVTTTTAPATVTEAPGELVAALDNFLLGRYQQAANVDPARLSDSRARYHALLVRAAARHVLSLLQGEAGAALLSQAQADVRAAKLLQPTAAPDASVFSPRFRQFYAATR